ncbi:MAG: hypothetical protein H0X17_08900 [Deltaproteobacteria bacterium]|nr:hypothetical protein [Deltaproteobacteria bacterium]
MSSNRMRIGEILLLREDVDALALSQTVREQALTGQRLVSILISRALIDSDVASLALSEQTGFPAALQRHLEARDEAVVYDVPAQLGRTWVVVPIGVASSGDLVVVARDPTPILAAALEHATGKPIRLAVAPAIHVERLVRSVYGAPGSAGVPLPSAPPSLSDIGEALVGVAKPHVGPARARTVSSVFTGKQDSGPIKAPMRTTNALEITLQEMDKAFSVLAVERLVMGYVAQRWSAALLVKIVGATAVGHGGHGSHLGVADSITLPLTFPSLLQVAHDERRTTIDAADSPVQQHLLSLLGHPQVAIAAPVECRNEVQAVLVVGDEVASRQRESIVELDRLADALGAAYDRFSRDR